MYNDLYLIITTEAMRNALTRLVEQKNARGYRVEIATCERIASLYPRDELHVAIRNHVLSKLETLMGRGCLLLVGDRESVPGYPILNPRTARFDVFVRNSNQLQHLRYGNGWGNWEYKGGNFASDPAAVAWGMGRLDIFARTQNNHLVHMWYGSNWGHWEDKGGDLASKPVAVSWGNGRLDILARNPSNHLVHLFYDRGWGYWQDLGGNLASDPVVVSWGKDRLDVFAKSLNNSLLHLWYDNGWGHWEDKGGNFASDPAAVSWGKGRLDIFARGRDNHLKHLWYDNGWGHWEDKGGSFQGEVSLSTWKNFDSDAFFSMRSQQDVVPTLLTGRISTNEPSAVLSICDQIVQYPQNADPSWTGRTILTGWIPRGNDVPQEAKDKDPGWQCVKEIGDYYEIVKQLENDRSVTAERRQTWDAEGNTRDTLITEINKGALIVRYVGHGYTTGWSNIGTNENFGVNDVRSLNVNEKMPLVISSSCLTGDIETPTSFAESWQKNLKAIGVVASDDPALTKFMDGFPQLIFQQIVRKRRHCIGEIINQAILQLHNESPGKYDSITAKMLRYFGDPDTILPAPRKLPFVDSIASWSNSRLDIFSKGPTNHLMHLWFDTDGWGHWEDKGGNLFREPSVVSWNKGRLDIFARSHANRLLHLWYDRGWGRWEDKRGYLTSDPVAVSWGKGRLDIFAKGRNNHLFHLWYDRNGWGRWEDKRGELYSPPAVVSWASGRLDIFSRSKHNTLLHLWYDRNGWGRWEDKGGELASDPVAVSWGPGRLDIFARSSRSSLLHLWYDGNWGHWEDKGGNLTSDPSVVSWDKGRLDIFARGHCSNLVHLWFNRRWGHWEDKGGRLCAKPTAVSWGKGRLDVFARDFESHLMHLWFERKWGRWEDLTPDKTLRWL